MPDTRTSAVRFVLHPMMTLGCFSRQDEPGDRYSLTLKTSTFTCQFLPRMCPSPTFFCQCTWPVLASIRLYPASSIPPASLTLWAQACSFFFFSDLPLFSSSPRVSSQAIFYPRRHPASIPTFLSLVFSRHARKALSGLHASSLFLDSTATMSPPAPASWFMSCIILPYWRSMLPH